MREFAQLCYAPTVSTSKLIHVSAPARWGQNTLWRLDYHHEPEVVGKRLNLADAHVGIVGNHAANRVVADARGAGDASQFAESSTEFVGDGLEKSNLRQTFR